MKKTTIYILACILAVTKIAARDYTKDVDVTVELQPEVRAASRLDIAPRAVLKSFPQSTLRYNGTLLPVAVTPMITTLKPVGGDPLYKASPYDGYLVAGYLPWGDLGVSAGYRLVSTRTTRLAAMTQLNRNSYRGYIPTEISEDAGRRRLTTTDFEVGLDFATVSNAGVLSAATSLYLSHFNYPGSIMKPKTQNVTDYRLSMKWQSTVDESASRYAIEGDLDHFGYGKLSLPSGFILQEVESTESLKELSGRVAAMGQLMFSRDFGMSVSIEYKAASLNRHYLYLPGVAEFYDRGKNYRGVVSVGAGFRFAGEHFNGHIGPVFDFGVGSLNGTNTGARGMLNWHMSPYVLVYATVESGTTLNTLGTLYDRSRYGAPLSAARPSFLDGDIKGGLSIGPFKGFSLTAGGGFAKASNWALPTIADGVSTFASTNINTAYYHAEMKYENGDRFGIGAGIEGVISNRVNHAYYKWNDRARQVVDAFIRWRPIDELTLEAGYELRLGR